MTNYKWLNTLSVIFIILVVLLLFIEGLDKELARQDCMAIENGQTVFDQECFDYKMGIN